jgi:two-component system, NtrC family, nitrogen regulation sensor histidine kinase GlnL
MAVNWHPFSSQSPASPFQGLDWLSSAVFLLDGEGQVCYLNSAAEQTFQVHGKQIIGKRLLGLFETNEELALLLQDGLAGAYGERSQDLLLARTGHEASHYQVLSTAHMNVGPVRLAGTAIETQIRVCLEMRPVEQRLRLDRETRQSESARANRELVRNLAHEIKNPLGGIRGAAQLLEAELELRSQKEYTQVIIKEADRLQSLVDRLLSPHRRPRSLAPVNIHEVCERVRSIVLAEYPQGLHIQRDYDASLPEFLADKELLIQAVLNLVHNAAQAMLGQGRIQLRTRIGRRVVLQHRQHGLALELHVIDQGPGIPQQVMEQLFQPLVSGREGGSGLGLSLAQSFILQHGGSISCESRPGMTDFKILLPLTG